jgi:hypothetical protein
MARVLGKSIVVIHIKIVSLSTVSGQFLSLTTRDMFLINVYQM